MKSTAKRVATPRSPTNVSYSVAIYLRPENDDKLLGRGYDHIAYVNSINKYGQKVYELSSTPINTLFNYW